MTQSDVLRYLIRKGPGRTELELARAIYGGKAYQQRVNQECYMMAIRLAAPRSSLGTQIN